MPINRPTAQVIMIFLGAIVLLCGGIVGTTSAQPTSDSTYGDTGLVNWSQTYETKQQGVGVALTRQTDGGLALAGYTDANVSDSGSEVNVTVVSTSSNGTHQWTSTVDVGYIDTAYDIIQTQDRELVIGGIDAFLKLDSEGEKIWTRERSGAFTNRALAETEDGKIFLVGNTCCSDDRQSVFAKTDSSGQEIWKKSVSVTEKPNSYLRYTALNIHNTFFVGVNGKNNNNAYLYAISDGGTHKWTQKFDNHSIIDITQLSDESMIVSGWDYDQNAMMVAKVKTNNGVLWNQMYSNDRPLRVFVTEENDIEVITTKGTIIRLNDNGTFETKRNYSIPENASVNDAVRVGPWKYVLGGTKEATGAQNAFWLAQVSAESSDQTEKTKPGDVTGNQQKALDPDNDGKFEDITGDGNVDARDVLKLWNGRGDLDPTYFDFTNDGSVDARDVLELWNQL